MPHTPGPWEIRDDPKITCQIIGPNELRVADVWCTDLPGGIDNARLIAAAPEMIQALKELVSWAKMSWCGGNDEIPNLEYAESAIAKAEGK